MAKSLLEELGIGKCNPDIFENKGYAQGWNAAMSLIEQFLATNNDRQNKFDAPWISVKDRLPEKEEFVLAIVSGKPRDNITLDETLMIATYYPNDAEWCVEEFPEWICPTVKYWMPVPDLPGDVK